MRRALAFALVLPALTLSFFGCGKEEQVTTPVACLGGSHQWLDALHEASGGEQVPVGGKVNLGGETPISDCIPPDQPAGQQETVGRTAVLVASRLARAYRSEPRTAARSAWEAGFLVGALHRGAERSQGIHATLVERIRSAATNGLGRMARAEQAAYKRGYEAGFQSG